MNRNRANRTGNIKKATAFTLSAAMLLGSTGVTAFAADSAKKKKLYMQIWTKREMLPEYMWSTAYRDQISQIMENIPV